MSHPEDRCSGFDAILKVIYALGLKFSDIVKQKTEDTCMLFVKRKSADVA